MSITLDPLVLPDALRWTDEFSWSPASTRVEWTLGGRPVIQTGLVVGQQGRPVTLSGGDDAWLTRAELLALRELSLCRPEDGPMTLRLHDGTELRVIFRAWETPVITAEPLYPLADPDAETPYILRELRLAVLEEA